MFDPIDADVTVTPQSLEDALARHDFGTALMTSLRLNIHDLIVNVVSRIPTKTGVSN